MNGAPDSPELLFDWPRPFRFRWNFFGLILLSAAAHLATFFLFQITYPPRVSIPPPAPEVSLLLPTTPENRAMLRRIESEDPALVATSPAVTPPNLAEPRYFASYETVRTQPRTVAIETTGTEAAKYPAPRDPLTFIRRAAQPAQLANVAPPPVATRLGYTAALAPRAPAPAPAWKFAPRATAPLEPAAFLIGVTDRGEVRYIFPQHSSGDPKLDVQAAAQLALLDFQRGDDAIVWGIVTITWGDDAYSADPPSAIRDPQSE